MYDQVVESCDCVDEETECSDARVQGRGVDTAGVECCQTSEQFAIGIITDTDESCQPIFNQHMLQFEALETEETLS